MAAIPNPYTAPANPRTFRDIVPTKDPLGYIRTDNGNASPIAISGALLYNHHGGPDGNGFVHNGLIGLLRGGSFGDGVDHLKYSHSSSVTLEETTPVNIVALPPRVLFGAVNTHDGYLSKHNDLSIVFPIVIFDSHRQKIVMQEKIYKDTVLPQATVRSLVPSLRHSQRFCQFFLQEIGGAVDMTIESLVHGDEALVKEEVLRRIHHLELSFANTLNIHMTNALATAPSIVCRWLMSQLGEAKEAINGSHPNPSTWIHKVLTTQLTSFCPSQLQGVSKRQPIRDLLKSLTFTSSEDSQRPIVLATTSTVAEMLMENNTTLDLPETQRVFYYQENGKRVAADYRPLQTYPGMGTREGASVPAIQVDGRKLPILKMPDQHDEHGNHTSSFVNYVSGMFVVPIGYALRQVPPVSKFLEVDFNAVRMTVFDQGGEDGEVRWHRDILGRSGLNDPALYDPHEYDKTMLILEGGEAAAKAFRSCYKGQAAYDEKVFSPTGITPCDPEFNLCVSNHVLYVGKSFGRTIPEGSTYSGQDPNSKFRLTGIDGNRPLCTVMGYLQAARSSIANLLNVNAVAENTFAPYVEACLRIPFETHDVTRVKETEINDLAVLKWLVTIPNLESRLLEEVRRSDNKIDPHVLHILKNVFRGSGISKWMNVPRVQFAILQAANLGVFTPTLHTTMEAALGFGNILEKVKFHEVVELLRKINSAIDSFCNSLMVSSGENDAKVSKYIFEQLPTVVPVANLPVEGHTTPFTCDSEISENKLRIRRMFLETVLNLLSTRLYTVTDLHEGPSGEALQFYDFPFQVQVHNKQKRCEKYLQPYFIGGFYTTYEYDADSKEQLRLADVTDLHPLLSGKPSPSVANKREENFYHSHVSRHFVDLRRMCGVPLCERVVAALACLRPHTPTNASTVHPLVQTHTAAHIVRYGTFETHRLVAIRTGDRENMYNGFIACATPVLTYKRNSNGGTALNVFMQTAPVLPNKGNTTIQAPHYFCRGCRSGMGHRMANIQGCLDGKAKLTPDVFEEEAFAVPVPSYFKDNEFDVPFFPIDGVYGPSFFKKTTLCDRPDILHTMEGAYGYNPMTRSNAPSEILVLNRRILEKTAGQVQLPPWSTNRHPLSARVDLRQRLAKLANAAKEGMQADAQWQPGMTDNYLNITPEDRICMFERFYHPGVRGHEYGQKSRSILGENSNSSLNWTQTLEPHHRMLTQAINPLDQQGRDRLINDTPRMNGFAY